MPEYKNDYDDRNDFGSPGGGGNRKSDGDFASWIPVLIFLFCFPPVGVVLLVLKLMGATGKKQGGVGRHPYDIQREGGAQRQQAAPKPGERGQQRAQQQSDRVQQRGYVRRDTVPGKQKKAVSVDHLPGRGLTVFGSIMAGVFGLGTIIEFFEALSWGGLWASMGSISALLGFFGVGLFLTYLGVTKNKKAKRYRKYLALIGRRDSISVTTLAQAMGVSVHKAVSDLQDMLDDGVFPTGYLDMSTGRLVLNGDGIQDEPEPESEPVQAEAPKGMEREEGVLTEIREVNDAIADPVMSAKIDRIGEITGKIFAYLREKPDKEGQLRSFLSYYLPTTLKILRAYAQMEAQGIEGENISAAKERIEGMMDKVVDGFEKQLDKLFQDDAMDITTDVEVLERMLDKDGLGGQGMTMGG